MEGRGRVASAPGTNAAGVFAGIDMALRLSELLVDNIAAKTVQLAIELCEQPPFAGGALSKVDDDVIKQLALYAEDKD
jgi:hypothetical protein